MKKILAMTAAFVCTFCAMAAGFDGYALTTNDWFDASFTALTADTTIAQGDTTGITGGSGSWTTAPTTGTAKIAADNDAGGEATFLSLSAPGEELTFTPAPFATTSGYETVSVEIKADAIDELPEVGNDVQAAFTVLLDENDALSAQGWTATGWTNLVYAATDDLTNAWFTLSVDFANVSGVRYVRYSVKPAAGALSALADGVGTTWFQAGKNADAIQSVSFSGTGAIRSFSGDELEAQWVATYNGVGYMSVEEAIAVGVADGWANGNVALQSDAEWQPAATGTYNIDVNGHALTVNGVVYTASGTTYEVSALNYYWIGGEIGEWSNGSNWSRTSGGEAAGNAPGSSDGAVFASAATVGLSGNCNVKYVRFDSDVTFTGDGALVLNAADAGTAASDAGVVSGAGNVILSNATLRAHTGYVVVTNNIVIANASTNHLTCTSGTQRYLHLYGALRGGGTAYCDQSSSSTNDGGVRFYGDTSQFSGSMYLIATNQRPTNWLADAKALDNANSTWYIETGAGREGQTFDGGGSNYSTYFPLRVSNATYEFGALNGYIPYAKAGTVGWLTGVNLKVGFLNEDCWLSGNWYRVTDSGLEWCAADATMRYAVTNTAFIKIDSGTVELTGAGVLQSGATVTFAGNGATLAFASGVDYDVSGFLSGGSTSAVAVDVEDNDLIWSTQLTDANASHGLVKKGPGKLTLATTPTYGGATVVEAGTLVVPQGTTIAELSCTGGKLTVPLAGTEDETEVLTIAALADGTTVEDVEAAVSVVGTTMSVVAGAGGYVVKATRTQQTFTWTGAVDTDWATPGNWTVGGNVAESLPIAIDTALFPASESTWEVSLSADAVASNVVFESNTEITGGSFKITTVEVAGAGTVTAKGLKLVSPSNEHLTIRAPLEIPADQVFETATGSQYKHVYLYSKVTGSGEWKMNQNNTNQRAGVQFHGDAGADMSEFAGTLTVINATSSLRDQTGIWGSIASSSNAVWNLVGFYKSGDDNSSLLKNSGTTYYFGALNGAAYASGNQSNHQKNIWEIGAREDVDSVLSGNFFCNTYTNLVGDRSDTIRKVGTGSTLTFSGSRVRAYEANAGVLKIGADVALLTTWVKDGVPGAYAPSITFNGGVLKVSDAVTLDVSTNIAKVASTSAITFDDEGVDHTWEVALPGSGGLTKKGAGTLTLSAVPLYTGLTTVEAGTLVVPEGADITVNAFSAGTISGITPSKFGYPTGTTLTGAETERMFDGLLDISNVTAIDLSGATLVEGQPYVIASADSITGYTGSSLAGITLTLPQGADASKWAVKVETIAGKRCLCVKFPYTGARFILR